ncbi:hypothetical protein AYI70_g1324 [Smittium culicis]|uniref:Uncharacterized protein n=1 Tax=Smittium culicis TaxID=133412 RepID=A0A1R1YD45_9FUNG|nr:hypothetical protein AYI70_g1324 [Smittium culicis]
MTDIPILTLMIDSSTENSIEIKSLFLISGAPQLDGVLILKPKSISAGLKPIDFDFIVLIAKMFSIWTAKATGYLFK